MKSKLGALMLALLFGIVAAPVAYAQATGTLSGTVTDPNGAIVQGANITVKNLATNLTRNITTNDDGRWTLTLLPVGIYDVTYEKEGFKKSVSRGIEVEASVSRNADVTLEVGSADVFVDITTNRWSKPNLQRPSARSRANKLQRSRRLHAASPDCYRAKPVCLPSFPRSVWPETVTSHHRLTEHEQRRPVFSSTASTPPTSQATKAR